MKNSINDKISTKKKILVADDDPGILEVIKIILEDKGYEVITVDDGMEVLKEVEKSRPDLVLLDIWMSGSDGRKIAKRLKKQSETSALPILIISALSGIEETTIAVGADGYVSKPFNIDDFVTTVEKCIGEA